MSEVSAATADGAMLEALLDLTTDPVWFVENDGTVTRCNAAFTRWRDLVSIDDDLIAIGRRALRGRSVAAEVHVDLAGIERTFAIHAQRLCERGILFVARDLGERSAIDAATERALVNLFTTEQPLASTVPQGLQFLCTSDGWDAAILWLVGHEGHLRPSAWWFGIEAAAFEQRLPSMRFAAGHGVPGRVFSEGKVLWIADILDESTMQRADLSAAAGLLSVVAVPVHDSERTIGVLEFFTRSVRAVDEARKVQLRRIGELLGHILTRHKIDGERRELLEMVERKGAEWMSTFDSIQLPIFLATGDGVIARLNRSARDLAGAGYDDLIGRTLRSIASGEPWTTLNDIAFAVRDSRMACTAQVTLGEQRWDVSASLMEAPLPEEERVIIVLHDTTQVMMLQESVRRGEQLAALGELVAGVAHEVKNPLFGLGVTLDVLEQMNKDPDVAEMLAAMRKWLGRLSGLTENLLEYGKTWTVDLKPGTIEAVLAQAVDACRPRAVEAGVTIDREGDSDGATVLMDAGRLSHVFENLLINAIQFSPAGERITISLGADHESVAFSVRDRGAGFNPDDFPRLCQPFFTRRRGGTGLGLAIVQRVVDEHGGTLTAINHVDGGAVVGVRFPRYNQDETAGHANRT